MLFVFPRTKTGMGNTHPFGRDHSVSDHRAFLRRQKKQLNKQANKHTIISKRIKQKIISIRTWSKRTTVVFLSGAGCFFAYFFFGVGPEYFTNDLTLVRLFGSQELLPWKQIAFWLKICLASRPLRIDSKGQVGPRTYLCNNLFC